MVKGHQFCGFHSHGLREKKKLNIACQAASKPNLKALNPQKAVLCGKGSSIFVVFTPKLCEKKQSENCPAKLSANQILKLQKLSCVVKGCQFCGFHSNGCARSKKLNIILLVFRSAISMPNFEAPGATQKKFELYYITLHYII